MSATAADSREVAPARLSVRVLACDAGAVGPAARALRPDIAILRGAPRRLRWRSPCAELARRLGLFYAAGGQPGLGNMIAVGHRVRVLDSWCLRYPLVPGQAMRGAVLAKVAIGDVAFVVVGTQLAAEPARSAAEAELLNRTVSEVDLPVILAGATIPATHHLTHNATVVPLEL